MFSSTCAERRIARSSQSILVKIFMYTVGDFAIRIKNAVMARRRKIVFPYTKVTKNLAQLLTKERYLKNVKEEEQDGKKVLTAEVAFEKRAANFTDVIIISKPSLRVYATKEELAKKQRR